MSCHVTFSALPYTMKLSYVILISVFLDSNILNAHHHCNSIWLQSWITFASHLFT